MGISQACQFDKLNLPGQLDNFDIENTKDTPGTNSEISRCSTTPANCRKVKQLDGTRPAAGVRTGSSAVFTTTSLAVPMSLSIFAKWQFLISSTTVGCDTPSRSAISGTRPAPGSWTGFPVAERPRCSTVPTRAGRRVPFVPARERKTMLPPLFIQCLEEDNELKAILRFPVWRGQVMQYQARTAEKLGTIFAQEYDVFRPRIRRISPKNTTPQGLVFGITHNSRCQVVRLVFFCLQILVYTTVTVGVALF